MYELNARERVRYTIDITIISTFLIYLIYLYSKKVYAEISGLYSSLTRTPELLDTDEIDKIVYYNVIIAVFVGISLSLTSLFILSDRKTVTTCISIIAFITGITMIFNIILLSTMKPKQRRIKPLMMLAQVNTLKSKIQKEVIVIFLIVAGGFYSIGTFIQYFQATDFTQIYRMPMREQSLYGGRQKRQNLRV